MVWTLREWEAATADSNGLGLGGWLGWSLGVQKQVKSSFGAGRLLASSLELAASQKPLVPPSGHQPQEVIYATAGWQGCSLPLWEIRDIRDIPLASRHAHVNLVSLSYS